MSVLGDVMYFFGDIGVFDVLLPFLLIFTIVYALLDKTRVLGIERVGDKEYAKRNVNSMVAFCVGFFVVAATDVARRIIPEIIVNTVMLLLLIVLFMLLVGTMHPDKKEGFSLDGWTKTSFYVIMFVGIIFIFLNAFGWLDGIITYILRSWNSQFIGVIVLIGVLVGVMWFVTKAPSEPKK